MTQKTVPIPQPAGHHTRGPWGKRTVYLLWASARWRSRPRTSSSGSSSVGLALRMVGQLGTSMLWQPRWHWLTEPCESVWSDFSDAGYSQPMRGKEGKEEGEGRRGWGGGKKRREKERGEWMKQSCLAPRVLSIPAHFWHTPTQPRLELTEDRKSLMCSQGMFWHFSKWNSHFTQRVCTCAWEGVRRRVQATEREREKPPRWKGELIWFCLHSSGHERQLNALHNMSTFQVHLRSAAISVSH